MRFSEQVRKFKKSAMLKTERVRNAAVLQLCTSIILDTPVDKGFLAGHWQLSLGEPNLKPNGRQDKSGQATVNAVTIALNGVTLDSTLYFSNPLPYGPRIEFDGYSSVKAPQGMVRKNFARFQGIVQASVAATR